MSDVAADVLEKALSLQRMLDGLAGAVDQMAMVHYDRDIRGELALKDWQAVSATMRRQGSNVVQQIAESLMTK